MNVLDELVAAARRRAGSLPELEAVPAGRPGRLAAALRGKESLTVMAEIKRRSPSRGTIRAAADPAALASGLVAAGARALSVLTEPTRFGGHLDDLSAVTAAVDVPVLMKDFVVDPRQVRVGAACGAAAVLLIARVLDDPLLAELLSAAAGSGLDALVECHDEDEVRRAVALGAELVGVNNRDLDTFTIDLERAPALLRLLPAEVVAVAESGYASAGDLAAVRGVADAVLIGGALMAAPDPARKLAELLR